MIISIPVCFSITVLRRARLRAAASGKRFLNLFCLHVHGYGLRRGGWRHCDDFRQICRIPTSTGRNATFELNGLSPDRNGSRAG